MTQIENFLKAKKAGNQKGSSFPIQFTDENNNLLNGFIGDAQAFVLPDNTHLLNVIVEGEKGQYYMIRKRCKAPIGCKVDWSLVSCAYDISKL